MSDVAQVTVVGKEELVGKYRSIAERVIPALLRMMAQQMMQTADYSRANEFTGGSDHLNRRTGRLSRAITGRAKTEGTIVTGQIGTSGIPYAYVHEVGGIFQIRAHTRRTGFDTNAARIRLLTKTGAVRAAVKSTTVGEVRAHSADYPRRAFLAPALEARREDITTALRETIVGALNAT